LVYVVLAVSPLFLSLRPPNDAEFTKAKAPPTWESPLGRDELGRDILSRVIYGTGIAFAVGLGTLGFCLLFGVALGLLAGYSRGPIDEISMRLADILLALPFFLTAVALVTFTGPSLETTIVVIGLSLVPTYLRLIRGMTLSIKEEKYIEGAVMSGESQFDIIFRYVLPNCLPLIIVQTFLDLPKAILMTSALSFLGLGVQPPTPEWGVMVATGRDYLHVAPHIALAPAFALFFMVMGFNFLGDGLRDILDPRMLRTSKV
jgi:ABC-type dipeptide/oligopeptide/nickel transport system permease subunit